MSEFFCLPSEVSVNHVQVNTPELERQPSNSALCFPSSTNSQQHANRVSMTDPLEQFHVLSHRHRYVVAGWLDRFVVAG